MIKFSIKRPVLTFVSMLIVILLGVISLINIPLQLIPSINPPVGVVVTTYDEAGPEEVNQQVTIPLEDQLATTPGLSSINSTSQEGSSLVLLQFSWSTNIEDVENDINQAISSVPMPDNAGNPRFLKFDPSQLPIINLSLSSDLNPSEFQSLVEDLQVELERINGIANVDVQGLATEEIEITLDEEELNTYQLTIDQVTNMLRGSHLSIPGASIEEEGQVITTRIISQFESIEDIEDFLITINPEEEEEVYLSDIATIERVNTNEDTITRTNQRPSVLIDVLESSEGNTAQVSTDFRNTLNNLLQEERFSEIEADILFDQGDYISRSIINIAQSLILGAMFAMLVIFLFLRNFRSPIIIGVAIPYSVIFTFVLMYFSNFTLNLLTMGGLALGVGMLVDNSILVIENINRYLAKGKDPKDAAYLGAKEVSAAIIAATLTTVSVFLPVVFIEGIIGQIFTEFSVTIAFSLIASLIVSLTVVPMLAGHFMKVPNEKWLSRQNKHPWYVKMFRNIAKFALRFRILVLGLVFVLLVASVLGIVRTGVIFLPETDEGFFSVSVDMGDGTSLTETREAVADIESYLNEVNGIETYLTNSGASEMGGVFGISTPSLAEIYVNMVPNDAREQTTNEIAQSLSDDLDSIVKSYNEDAEINIMTSSSTGTDSSVLTFNIVNDSQSELDQDEEKLRAALEDNDMFESVSSDLTQTIEEIAIHLNQESLFENQLSAAQVSEIFTNTTQGMFAFTMLEDTTESVLNVRVVMPEDYANSVDAIEDIVISQDDDDSVTLGDVAEVERQPAPTTINRINGLHAYQFEADIAEGYTLSEAARELQSAIDQLNLSAGTETSFTGDQELIDDSAVDMLMAMLLAIILVYLVMAAQFESFKYPFIMMFSVPLSIIGILLALFITNTPLSVPVFIGVLVLIGIVVNNGIVFVDFINQYRERGFNAYDAIIESVTVRTRPILMTALTTMLALIPIAIGFGEGSEINQPMGISVIGGLFASTFLSLIIVPIVYSLMTRETLTMNQKKNRHKFDRQKV